MAFNYYETYRLEGADEMFVALRGAAQTEDNRWIFFGVNTDPYHSFTPQFKVLRFQTEEDGTVVADVESAPETVLTQRFVPVTKEYIRANPTLYSWLSPDVVRQLDVPGVFELILTGLIPEWYVKAYAPPEEQEDFESEAFT
jgi:hypothetical protein